MSNHIELPPIALVVEELTELLPSGTAITRPLVAQAVYTAIDRCTTKLVREAQARRWNELGKEKVITAIEIDEKTYSLESFLDLTALQEKIRELEVPK